MHLPDEPDIPPQINIVPMIDVIFAILAFFIISTLFLTKSEGLPVNLPNAKNTVRTKTNQRITVTIDAVGQITLEQQPVSLDSLENSIRATVVANQNPLVIINADVAVNHGQVIAVMDRLRGIDGVRMAIATSSKRPTK